MFFPINRKVALATAFVVALPVVLAPVAHAAKDAGAPVFTFQDYLNHDWTNELVRVPLTAAQARQAAAKPALLGPDGQVVPYQLGGEPGQSTTLEFLANVKAGERSTYKFGSAAAPVPAGDLALDQTATSIKITNSLTGIALRKNLEAGQGPVESMRLASGKWIGGSRLGGKATPASYTAKVVSDGPVYKEVECRTEFPGGGEWVLDFRLAAHEPVVVIRETMSLGDEDAAFSLSLSDNFDPDQLFFRCGMDGGGGRQGTNMKSAIKPGTAFVLEPWLRWFIRPEEGPVFSVYRNDLPDMLSVGAGFASLWVDPKIPEAKRSPPFANLVRDDQGLHLDFTVKNGRRQWMIMAPDKAASLAVLDGKNLNVLSIPHAYVIKHGQFPLNLVKDYVLDWPNESEKYPHLLLTRSVAAKYRAEHAQDAPLSAGELNNLVNTKPLSQWNMERPLELFYGTGEPAIGKYLLSEGTLATQGLVDSFLQQPEVPYGSAPHHQQDLGSTPLVLDAVLESNVITPEERKRLLAQIAFCGYAINRPDYWSPERGYCANPNMTTSVQGYQVAIGSLIPSHPKAKEWVSSALAGMKGQLYGWSDDNGGWLEAPHYAMVSYDAILGSALIAHNAGLSEMVYDPRFKTVANWFSKWSTPPDSRFAGYRHLPPVGNTYISEPTGEFGILAAIWKDKDPKFAAEMQWMYHQQKSREYPGVGGGYPTMAGYRHLLRDETIKDKAPSWTSEIFPNTGVVLRNGYPSDRETYLLLLAGSFGGWRSHYDDDSGSMTIWGKGRILCDDFGYFNPSADDHNLPWGAEISAGPVFNVKTFAPSEDFDYVAGSRGSWQRQIALVKNSDPLAPNYYVITDTTKTSSAAKWTLCFTAAQVTPNAGGAMVTGKDDVDTDVFFSGPTVPQLTTETKTRTSNAGVRPDLSEGPVQTTQIALKTTPPLDGAMTYVLYPRLKTEKPPLITSIADGRGVKVQTDAETDYVFLSAVPISWQGEGVSFNGKSGAVRLRGDRSTLSLGEEGSIGARGQVLTAKEAARKEFGG